MRIDRLDLWRFGKFTDLSIEFGEHEPGKADLHVVYGPNEAGKTTLMAAYLDFLFGFDSKPKVLYNFKHANNVLKVGAVVSIDDEAKEYRRIKKTKDSLLDKNDQPVSGSVIAQQLAGLGKDSYVTMFSLNDDSLEKGGESILASEGDLGKLLYSATTGVAQLSESLLEMHTQTDHFYKKQKRKFELAELKSQLKSIEVARKQLDTEASGYSKLVKSRVEADERYERLGAAQDQLKLHIDKLQLLKTAFPRLNALSRLQTEIQPLASLPEVPESWFDEVRKLRQGSVEYETREQDYVKKHNKIDELISAFELDGAALDASSNWQQIELERDRYFVATSNLPDALQQMRLCENEITNCLRNLDCVDTESPATLLLNTSTQANIKTLIQQQAALQSKLDTANKEWVVAKNRTNEVRERFLLEGGNVEDNADTFKHNSAPITELEREVSLFGNNELTVQYRAKEQHIAELSDVLAIKFANLSPWRGDGKDLQLMSVPHESELKLLQKRRDLTSTRITEIEHSINTLTKSIEHTRSQQRAYSFTGLTDDTESSRMRRERDEAWVKHRQQLDAVSADEFERAMRVDDASQSTRLQNTEKLAELGQMTRQLFVAEESLTKANAELDQCHVEQAAVTSDVEILINNLSQSLSKTMSIEAIDDWLTLRSQTLLDVQKMAVLERELTGIQNQVSSVCGNITQCLVSANVSTSQVSSEVGSVNQLATLLKIANTTLKREAVISGFRDQLIASEYQVRTRRDEVDSAKELLEQWNAAWKQECESCWLGAKGIVPGVAAVEEMLSQLRFLEQQLTVQAGLQEKISTDETCVDKFNQSMSALAKLLSLTIDGLTDDQLYSALQARINKAVADQGELLSLQNQKNESLEQQQLNNENRAVNIKSIERMSQHFSVQSIDEVEMKLQDTKIKENLQLRVAGEQQELLGMLSVTSIKEATDLLTDFDQDSSQLKLDELERKTLDLGLQLQEAHTLREQARNAMESVGGDEAVALLAEKRANLLLDIGEKSTKYLQQHLALMAADAALKKYRDNHRSSMMKKASDAFTEISQGRYRQLDTVQDGGSEKLIAIDRDGESKQSNQLSKGTRFQLYLALRVAGYREYSNTRPSVPFIADDIMETFDDERAARTFAVLGDMSSHGQVIYLTHHQHLCDIAKKVVPSCQIHQLG